jgi:hypothetical protein
MSPTRVKRLAMPIPIEAIGVSYPERNGAIPSERIMMIHPERVRSERIFPEIFAIIFSSSWYLVSSRTVIV